MTALAWGLILAAVADTFIGFALAVYEHPGAPGYFVITMVNAGQHLLVLGGVYAVDRTRAGGHGVLARTGFTIALLGLALLAAAEPTTLVNLKPAYALFGIAMLAMTVGMTMAGVAVARAAVWHGASRFSLLAVGLYIPLVMVPSMFFHGLWFHYAIGLWGLVLLWLGVTVLRTPAR